jgi:hypothetical protein
MILLFLAAAAEPMAPIDVPYQALPAFTAYTQCVLARFEADPRVVAGDASAVRQANADAVAACGAMREEQLARGVAAVGDKRRLINPRQFKSRADAQAAVRSAFDRFDTEFRIEQAPPGNDDAKH